MSISTPSEKELVNRFECLLTRHAEIRLANAGRLVAIVERVIPAFLCARKAWAESQKALAEAFNLFAVLEIEGDEVRHSKILAWLLDHRIEHGTHAQRSLGLRLFLKHLEKELFGYRGLPAKPYADEPNYWVHRELSGNKARVDIEIAARNKFLIHIENKIFSVEGAEQTDREWEDLRDRAKGLGVPENACHAIFLTLDGSEAANKHFQSVSWSRIAGVLDDFAAEALPAEVKLFANHYARAVRQLVGAQSKQQEDSDVEIQRA